MATLLGICSVLFVIFNITSGLPTESTEYPSLENCGKNHLKTSYLAQYPWMAILHYRQPNSQGGFFCGGALIHEKYVITAAHCVRGPSTAQNHDYDIDFVRIGGLDLKADPRCEQNACADEKSVPVDKIIVHENYDPSLVSHANDIALIRLEHAVQLNEYIGPICLPLDKSLQKKTYEGSDLEVTGFGRTENVSQSLVLMKADTSGFNFEQCSDIYQKASSAVLTSKQLCAGTENGSGSICSGDAGGPLMAYHEVDGESFQYLVGVATLASLPCGTPGHPDVFTRVDHYTDWISEHMKE